MDHEIEMIVTCTPRTAHGAPGRANKVNHLVAEIDRNAADVGMCPHADAKSIAAGLRTWGGSDWQAS